MQRFQWRRLFKKNSVEPWWGLVLSVGLAIAFLALSYRYRWPIPIRRMHLVFTDEVNKLLGLSGPSISFWGYGYRALTLLLYAVFIWMLMRTLVLILIIAWTWYTQRNAHQKGKEGDGGQSTR